MSRVATQFQRNAFVRFVALLLVMICAAAPALAAACPRWSWATRCCCPDPALCHCPGNSHAHEADEADNDEDAGNPEHLAHKAPSLRRCSNTGDMDDLAVLAFCLPGLTEIFELVAVTPAPASSTTNTPCHRWVSVDVPPF